MKSVLVGFGRIGDSIRHDKKIARYFPYASHAQILTNNKKFKWAAVVDPSDNARKAAGLWDVKKIVKDASSLRKDKIEFAVLATPPDTRLGVIKKLPDLKAVLIEKPLGREGEKFLNYCMQREIDVQINFWRRGVPFFMDLANGGVEDRVGKPQAVFCTYGNGLYNNGSHLVDFIRMLFGPVEYARATARPKTLKSAGCSGTLDDLHAGFVLGMQRGFNVIAEPLNFNHYREVSVDIWGEKGRLMLGQESLSAFYYKRTAHRGMERQREVASDKFEIIRPDVGSGMWNIYNSFFGIPLSPATMDTEVVLNEIARAA